MAADLAKAQREIAEGNPWYTCDQMDSCQGTYRHSMALRAAYVARHLQLLPLSRRTVVDVGCGDGYWSRHILGLHDVRLGSASTTIPCGSRDTARPSPRQKHIWVRAWLCRCQTGSPTYS